MEKRPIPKPTLKRNNIVFLIDTSIAMAQIVPEQRLTLLDVVKTAVYQFVHKKRQGFRFFLVTFADKNAVKIGWDKCQSADEFLHALALLAPTDTSDFGGALAKAFRLLKAVSYRSITYGEGWRPWLSDPAAVIALTYGGMQIVRPKSSDNTYFASESYLFPSPNAGEILEQALFTWDVRLFTIQLGFPGLAKVPDIQPKKLPNLNADEENKVWHKSVNDLSQIERALKNCFKESQQKRGVLVGFEDVSKGTAKRFNDGAMVREILLVNGCGSSQAASRKWPIPECFLPKRALSAIPKRAPFPHIRIFTAPDFPINKMQLPFDKYELVPKSPLSMYLNTHLEGRIAKCFLYDSQGKGKIGQPFAFVRAEGNGKAAMYIGPYDYVFLNSHLDKFHQNDSQRWPNPNFTEAVWAEMLMKYIDTVPTYYRVPLRNALAPIMPSHLVPRMISSRAHSQEQLPERVVNQIRSVHQYWISADRLRRSCKDPPHRAPVRKQPLTTNNPNAERKRKLPSQSWLDQEEEDRLRMYATSTMGQYNQTMQAQEAQEFRDAYADLTRKKRKIQLGGNPYKRVKKRSAFPPGFNPKIKDFHRKPKSLFPSQPSPSSEHLINHNKLAKETDHSLIKDGSTSTVAQDASPSSPALSPASEQEDKDKTKPKKISEAPSQLKPTEKTLSSSGLLLKSDLEWIFWQSEARKTASTNIEKMVQDGEVDKKLVEAMLKQIDGPSNLRKDFCMEMTDLVRQYSFNDLDLIIAESLRVP